MLRRTTEEVQGCCPDHVPGPGRAAGWLSCFATFLLLFLASPGWLSVCSAFLTSGWTVASSHMAHQENHLCSEPGRCWEAAGVKARLCFPASLSAQVCWEGMDEQQRQLCARRQNSSLGTLLLSLYYFTYCFMVPVLT